MGNYTIFQTVRKSQERQASKQFYNKCSENSRSPSSSSEQIFSENCYMYAISLPVITATDLTSQKTRPLFALHYLLLEENLLGDGGVLPGGEPPCSLTPGLISDKKKVIFHAFFQSWPPGRNYVKEFANVSFSFLFFNWN